VEQASLNLKTSDGILASGTFEGLRMPVPLARIPSQFLMFKYACSTRQDTISSFKV
jgi:hypothetical protein